MSNRRADGVNNGLHASLQTPIAKEAIKDTKTKSVVVHIRLTAQQRNTLKAVLSLEGATMQEYFEAKAVEKIATLLTRA